MNVLVMSAAANEMGGVSSLIHALNLASAVSVDSVGWYGGCAANGTVDQSATRGADAGDGERLVTGFPPSRRFGLGSLLAPTTMLSLA